MKKTKVMFVGCILFFAVVVGLTVNFWRLNKKIHGDHHIVSQQQSVSVCGLKYSITDSNIYEMAAFAEAYPQVRDSYSYSTNIYVKAGMPEGFTSMKYVVGATLRIQNISTTRQKINYWDYKLTSRKQNFYQGVDPELLQTLNGGTVETELDPGEHVDLLLNYDLMECVDGELSVERLKKEKLMIPVSGYPKLDAIELSDAGFVKSDGSFDPYQKADTGSGGTASVQDTPAGTVLAKGQTYVQNGVSFTVEQVDIVTNLLDYEGYQKNSWLPYYASDFVKEDGSFTTIAESGHGLPKSYYQKGYHDYAIFVKLKLKNHTSAEKQVYNGFSLYNAKNTLEGTSGAEYTSALNAEDEQHALQGVIPGNGEQELVLGYTRSIRADKDIYHEPLYISNKTDTSATQFDLKKGKGGFGIYLQIQ